MHLIRTFRWLTSMMVLISPVLRAASEGDVYFDEKVLPILNKRCFECHSHEKKIKGALTLDSRSGWEIGGETGPAIIPGKPEKSLLITAIYHEDEDVAMPPKKKLSDGEIAILVDWVKMGAPDPRVTAIKSGTDIEEGRKHWAFQPITKPVAPTSAFPQISNSPIDRFLFTQLEKNHLKPAPLADRLTLLRRATYDITGMPPTSAEILEYINSPESEDIAFSKVIDRLLSSPTYGEKWGKHWLDLVHYADTTGCSSDWPIDDMWRYRDWVIQALNEDKPFDQFISDQLAGDLEAADMLHQSGEWDEKLYQERIVATGFLATAKRFGSDPGANEYLTIGDSLDTTWKALQGLTVGCARCHDHKFDPVKASDYYALYGILASSLYPYNGAEKNFHASLLVPLDRPEKSQASLDAWNREMPGVKIELQPRSVLASFSNAWNFEDQEVSEEVSDRPPISPWVSKGGVAVRTKNSTFTHLFPLGMKNVEFQATAPMAEMKRRVRWEKPESPIRSFAFDLLPTSVFDSNHQLKIFWKPSETGNDELEIAAYTETGLTIPGKNQALPLSKDQWHHLSLSYALDKSSVSIHLWDATGQPLENSEVAFPLAEKLRGSGDWIVRFETGTQTDKRIACIHIDNMVAHSNRLPEPSSAPVSVDRLPDGGIEAIYNAILPRKPQTAFAMWEGTPHDVALQKRGEPMSLGPIIPRRNLLVLGGQPIENPEKESGRRDLARWMNDDANPLTHRVFINRIWQWHFGRGIVSSSNDFGHKGELPSHPELLDYLVNRFRENGLSIKAMHREIMLSHAYRQSSETTTIASITDPENRLLSRFSPRRLIAEEIRDSVLTLSGLLDPNGKNYRQPFPPLHIRGYSQHSPFSLVYEANYTPRFDHRKRSIYLPVVRQIPDPFLSTFDGSDSNQSVAFRTETAVPLQGLALLNAPFVLEAANALGEQAMSAANDTDAIQSMYRNIFGVSPNNTMTNRLAFHLSKMTKDQGIARKDALAITAQALFSNNSFLYLY